MYVLHTLNFPFAIGIHFFDLLLWLFGSANQAKVHLNQPRKMAGVLELDHARIRWFLSTDADDLPDETLHAGGYAYRSLTFDGQEIEFSKGFNNLHTRAYEEILAGRGTGINDARPAIELAHAINNTEVHQSLSDAHPYVTGIPTIRMPDRIMKSRHSFASKAA